MAVSSRVQDNTYLPLLSFSHINSVLSILLIINMNYTIGCDFEVDCVKLHNLVILKLIKLPGHKLASNFISNRCTAFHSDQFSQ